MEQHRRRHLLGPGEGRFVQLGGLGVRFMIDGASTGGAFSLVEHPIAPRTLAAPMHTHGDTDEYSFVLAGRLGVQIGEDVLVAEPGELVTKPRGVPHAFWNAGDEPARLLELITPAGFEQYFAEIATLFDADGTPLDPDAVGDLMRRHRLDVDVGSAVRLVQQHRLER